VEHGVQEIDSGITVEAGHENRLTGPISSVASLGAAGGRVELELRKEGCSSSLYS
jgi:hypothetical protein